MIKMSIIKKTSGSCILTMGETKMIEWIKRPKEGKGKKQENKGSVKCFFTQAHSQVCFIKKISNVI